MQFYNVDNRLKSLPANGCAMRILVIMHEWNDPQIVNSVLALKQSSGFRALFHDTHHRAYSNAAEILRFRLDLFDGVLAFGEAIRKTYVDGFEIARAWTFHEAADIEKFKRMESAKNLELVSVGNWAVRSVRANSTSFSCCPRPSWLRGAARLLFMACVTRLRFSRIQREGIELGDTCPTWKRHESARKHAYGACTASAVLKWTEWCSNDSRV